LATVGRIECPKCNALCIDGEANCWQCHALLKPTTPAPATVPAPIPAPDDSAVVKSNGKAPATLFGISLPGKPKKPEQLADPGPLIQYDEEHLASAPKVTIPAEETLTAADGASGGKRVRVSLTGEIIEDDAPESPDGATASNSPASIAAKIGADDIVDLPSEEVMVLTFCKQCGYQNVEGVKECAQCGKQLDIIAVSEFREIEALPRAWGFDVLGAVWVILGVAAIFAGQFLVKTDASRAHASIADYLWTGVVAIAPGVLVFMRHHFCRALFWVMTLASFMIWSVIFIVWITGHLHVSDKGQVGLSWIFALSMLSGISFFLVRTNDAFDYDVGVWLGRQ
jgi:hypothetical protein